MIPVQIGTGRLLSPRARSAIWAAVLGATLVALIGVPLSAALNIWVDEAFTLHTTGSGPLVAWTQAIVFEQQPPFYFLLESLWRRLDEASITFARLPSIVFAAAGVAAIVATAYRISPRVPSLVVALVTALNPIVIWVAVEMRVFALVFLIAAVLNWTFYEGFLVSRPSRRANIAYLIFAVAGLYTQYYLGFILAAHFITLLTARRSAIAPFTISMAVTATAFAPFIGVAIMHVRTRGDFVLPVNLMQAIYQVSVTTFMFILPHTLAAAGTTKIVGFALAATSFLVLLVIGRPSITDQPRRAFLIQWLACVALFSLVFWTSGVPGDPLRHLVAIAPASLLATFLFMSSLTRIRRLAGGIALVAFAVLALTSLWKQYDPLSKPGDWQRVAATLAADNQSTPIAMFPAESVLPLSWYLPVATIPIPKPMPFTFEYVHSTTLTKELDVAHVLAHVRGRSSRLWLVTDGECRDSDLDIYKNSCEFLERYMNQHYRVTRSIAFRGSLARLYVSRRDKRDIAEHGSGD